MRIRMMVGAHELFATLDGSAAAESFAAMLPLEFQLDDYHGIEKIADLPGRLDTSGAPAGCSAAAGDITYYAPWGNLAIFYKDFGFVKGLVHLGRIEGTLPTLAGSRPLPARIERA